MKPMIGKLLLGVVVGIAGLLSSGSFKPAVEPKHYPDQLDTLLLVAEAIDRVDQKTQALEAKSEYLDSLKILTIRKNAVAYHTTQEFIDNNVKNRVHEREVAMIDSIYETNYRWPVQPNTIRMYTFPAYDSIKSVIVYHPHKDSLSAEVNYSDQGFRWKLYDMSLEDLRKAVRSNRQKYLNDYLTADTTNLEKRAWFYRTHKTDTIQ